MLIVSLTGGIASGKSVVADVFKNLGCYIYQADRVAHRLMEPGTAAWKKIVRHFGQEVLNQDETINRSRLGAIIFSDPKKRHYLNSLIHPLVMDEKKKVIQHLLKEGRYKIFISEAALTLEAGFKSFFDRIVVVYCQPEIQVPRLMKRDSLSRKEALRRVQSQLSPEEKTKFADYIIDSSGTLAETVEQTERIFRNLMLDHELKQTTRKYH